MRARSIAAVFVAVLLVGSLVGCSKKDSGSNDNASDKTEETQKSTTSESDDSSSDGASTGDIDISDVLGDCGDVYVLYSTLIASSAAMMAGVTDEQVQELEDQAAKVRSGVPQDLQDDIEIVADAYQEFAMAVAENGIASPKTQAATEKLDSPDVSEAQSNLEEYFNSCES